MPERTNRDPAPGFVAFDTLLAEALREQTRRELAALPGPRQLAQLYPDTSAWDKRLKKTLAARRRAAARAARAARKTAPPHRRLPLRRLAAIAAVFVLLMAGTLAASAEVRYAARVLLHWGDTELHLSFTAEGRPLETMTLPEGYIDHYVPDGFVLDEENSFMMQDYLFRKYYGQQDGEQKSYDVSIYVIQPDGQTEILDNEHTTYEEVEFGGVVATLGTSSTHEDEKSYYLFWDSENIHHLVHGNLNLEEILNIAEEIY